MIESLVEQIEARHAEVQAQMSDPEVIGDRQRFADAGRLFNQLAPAAKLAEEWRRAVDDAEGAQELLAEGARTRRSARCSTTARTRIAELEEEIRLAMVERDPSDDKNVIVEIRAGAGGEEAGLWAGDLYRMFTALRGAARLQDRDDERVRGLVHVRDPRRRRLLRLQVRGRDAPRAARARDGVAGPHPHLDRDGRGAAGGRGGRRPDRPERPRDRRLPLVRARAASPSTRPTPPCASRTSRRASSCRCRTRSRSCRTASAR